MFEQFTLLIAKVDFRMKRARGRPCGVKVGDEFYVTNPKHDQHRGIIVDRASRATLCQGYLLTIEQVRELFTVVE